MVVDVSKPFATDSYFEIETAMLEAAARTRRAGAGGSTTT